MSKKQFRPETTSEHIARDMLEGRFPEKSPVQMVPVEAPAHAEPVAWVIPGDDNAKCNGFLDAMAHEEGEFSQPLYAHPPTDAAEIERLTTRLKEERALYAETDGKRCAAEARAEKAEAERDAALAQVAAAITGNKSGTICRDCRGVGMIHCSDPFNCGGMQPYTVEELKSALSRRDAQMRAEGMRRALDVVSENADWPEDEHGRTEHPALFARISHAILAAAEKEASNG